MTILGLCCKIDLKLQNTSIKVHSKFCLFQYINLEFHIIKEYAVCLVCLRHENCLKQAVSAHYEL